MGTRYGSDKEVAAVTFNLKQQIVMEKKMHTLSLEESYSLKLLELDHRIIKVNYRRLKDKVSKIKSFLTADEIADMKDIEARGKMKPTYNTLNLTGALKIASAEKRLKLNGSRPKTSVPSTRDKLLNKRDEDNAKTLKRCHSVAGVFIGPKSETTRPKTAFPRDERSKNTTLSITPGVEDEWKSPPSTTSRNHPRPVTSIGGHFSAMPGRSHRNNDRAQTAPTKKSRNPYSSHDVAEKDARASNGSTAPEATRDRSLSVISNGSIDSNLGEDQFAGRRQELIELETQTGMVLDSKRKDFLKRVGEYVETNPLLAAPDKATTLNLAVLPGHAAMTPDATTLTSDIQLPSWRTKRGRRRLTMVEFETGYNEEDYQRRIKDSWKNLNKCRYLRLPDERIDLSGYNTLATDQIKLLHALRKKNHVSFLSGVQVTG